MKKAVITSGGKQHLVSEGDIIDVELISTDKKPEFEPLLIIDGDSVKIGAPTIENAKVSAEIVEKEILGEKVTAIRYKAKKRVKKVRGHRQKSSRIKITKIS